MTRRSRTRRQDRRRDRRLASALVVLAVAGTALLVWRVAFSTPALAVPTRLVESKPAGSPVEVVFGGDTMLADGQVETMGHGRGDEVLSGLVPLLAGADEVVINAEAPITALTDGGAKGAKYAYSVLPSDADALARAGVSVLNLGNNHAMDRGLAGLNDTIGWAKGHGISTLGAGANRAQAEQPLMISTPNGNIALVSLGENFGPASRSSSTDPGIVTFSPDRIIRGKTLAERAGADLVIAIVHWGDNYAAVNDQQRYWAAELVAAGYDLVIGSGSHTLQTVERINGVPVIYGLGNFAFGSPGRYDTFAVSGTSAVARLSWNPGGTTTVRLSCIQNDNEITNYLPRPCNPDEGAQVAQIVGSEVAWDGVSGVIEL